MYLIKSEDIPNLANDSNLLKIIADFLSRRGRDGLVLPKKNYPVGNKLESTLAAVKKTFLKDTSDFISFENLLLKSSLDSNIWYFIETKAIGKGAFGQVTPIKWKITLTKEGIVIEQVDLIVKAIKPQGSSPQEELIKIKSEQAYLAKHEIQSEPPVIIDNTIYLVMENCGDSLQKFLNDNKLSFDEILTLLDGIFNEYQNLQNESIVHRDLKPANICVKKILNPLTSKYGFRVCFVDFGLATYQTDEENATRIAGTLLFMAPEIFENNGKSTPASDMYSLSAIFGEVCYAKGIYDVKELCETANTVAYAPYDFRGLFHNVPIPEDVDSTLLKDIEKLFDKMQSEDPNDRPTVDFLRKFISGIYNRRELNRQINLKTSEYHSAADFCQELKSLGLSNTPPIANPRSLSEKMTAYSFECFNQEIQQIKKLDSHLLITQKITNANKLVSMYDSFAVENGIDDLIQKSHNKIYQYYGSFIKNYQSINNSFTSPNKQANKFVSTNSSGIKQIQTLLNDNTISTIDKLDHLQKIGKSKTTGAISCWYSRSHLFGKGRHEKVDDLYKKLANLDQAVNKDDFLAGKEIKIISDFIKENAFVHSLQK